MSSAENDRNGRAMRIGTRLTLWGSAFTLAICATVCVALYVGLNLSLHSEIDSFLEGEVQEFRKILHDEGDSPFTKIELTIREELGSRDRKDLSFRLLATSGERVLSSQADDSMPNPWPRVAVSAHGSHDPWFDTVRIPGPPNAIRACSQIIELPGRGTFIAQATYTLATVQASLARFRELCIVVMALAALLSLIGGRVLARKSLRPVAVMAQTARQIGTTNLNNRLDCIRNGDELDYLATVLNEMLDRLEKQVRRIQQFTADAAHELRTPLAALRGSAEVALGGRATDTDRRCVLEDSIEEFDRLSRLTDNLLLLGRADAGQDLLQREPVELVSVVRDVVDLYTPLAQEKGVSIACAIETNAKANADGGRLRQVVSNLFDNAVKYSPSGTEVKVTLRSEGARAILTIEDAGCGISPDHLPRIFDRFFRADAARTRSTVGFGLGLAICRTIIESHGGKIQIESEENHGTRVQCILPII